MTDHLTYLASPYSDPDQNVRRARHDSAKWAFSSLMKAQQLVYSPILHCAATAEGCALPTSWDYWEPLDRAMITRCQSISILTIPGWRESRGVQAEIAIARTLGLPIRYVDIDGRYHNQVEP